MKPTGKKKIRTSREVKFSSQKNNSGTYHTPLRSNNPGSDKKQDKIQPKKIQKIIPPKTTLEKRLHPEVTNLKAALKQLKVGDEHAKKNVRTLRKKIDLILKKENLTKKEKRILFNLKVRCKKVIRLKSTDQIETPVGQGINSQKSFGTNIKTKKSDQDKLLVLPSQTISSNKKNKLAHIIKSQLKENLSDEPNKFNSEHGGKLKLKVKSTVKKSTKDLPPVTNILKLHQKLKNKSIDSAKYTLNQSNIEPEEDIGFIKQKKKKTNLLKLKQKFTGQLKKQVDFPLNLTSSPDGESCLQELSKTKKKSKEVKAKLKPFKGTSQLEIPNDPNPIQNKLGKNYLHSDPLCVGSPTDESNELTTIKSINKILKKLKSTEDVQIQETIGLLKTHINTKVGKHLRKLLKHIVNANDELK
ncbi:uncharacterized protein LOC114345583 isoform X1 [Diabrotica virgifera virgifera]|uniref:Uncharacterized protein n=1 Tax=Diabrotica virgifera virgifera TaxID=50390 RepID=A0ABM5JN62_DIAVI|nr:uncharacterized protein LOC114345583 isoform X1 [Diabrotica virgifera virgifera]